MKTCGAMESQRHRFLTSAMYVVKLSSSSFDRFKPEQIPRHHSLRGLSGSTYTPSFVLNINRFDKESIETRFLKRIACSMASTITELRRVQTECQLYTKLHFNS